jgi:hypothetical protein
MTRQQQFFPLRGGLDQETPAISIPPGRIIGVQNHEATPRGYQRTEGFERFDGHAAPSAANFYTLTFTQGNAEFLEGDTITGLVSGATCRVLADALLESGSYGGADATGTVAVHLVVGTFVAAEQLQVAAVTRAHLNTAPVLGDWRDRLEALAWLVAAQTYARNFITQVPGSGSIRGLVFYGGKLNAWRDNAAASAGVLYHSSAAGWTATDLGTQLFFNLAGPYELKAGDTISGDQSAATATVRYVGVDTGDFATSDAAGVLILDNVVGTFGDETISANAAQAAIATTTDVSAVAFPPGGRYEFEIFNFYATDTFERCYGANGVSKAFDFDGDSVAFITTGMESVGLTDTPKSVHEHKSHLFLTFEQGSLQHSSLGSPRDFSGVLGAAELGLGHDITNVVPNTSAVMLIFTDTTVSQLTGNDSSDWLLEPIAEKDAGAKAHTAQKIGDVIYLDNRGIRNAASTATFANFRLGTYTDLINKELARKRLAGINPVASCVIKSKDQYLLFFDDGSGISLWFGSKKPEAMLFEYPFTVSCVHVAEVDSEERCWVGTEDGWVFELNKGTSFDGDIIEAYLQLPFNHSGSPRLLKRYHKLELELSGEAGTQLGLITQFNGGDGEQPLAQEDDLTLEGGGGIWNIATWAEFVWSAPLVGRAEYWVDGMGVDMGPIFVSRQSEVESYTLSGVTAVYSPRGAKR